MAKSGKPTVSRMSQSSTRPIRIRLRQIATEAERNLCHRAEEALKEEKIESLAESQVSEGTRVPMTVAAAGQTIEIGGQEYPLYRLVGGSRRREAIQLAIEKNLDSGRFHEEMEVDATEMVQGEGQSEEDFERDLLVWSVGENEQRLNFTVAEKLAIVKRFKTAKVPASRAASALASSESQYRRLDRIVKRDWMHEAVIEDCIGTTDASKLLEEAEEAKWTEGFRANFQAWIADRREDLKAEADELAKLGKELTGSAANVKKYLTRDLARHWLKCIKEHKDFDDNVEFPFGVVVDAKNKTVDIPAISAKADDLQARDLRKMIAELQNGARRLVPLLRQRQLVEAATSVSDDEVETELRQIDAERRREEAERKAAEAGRPAPDYDRVDEPDPRNLAGEISQQREALDDDEGTEE